ncbi:MAG TPA: phage holin family protein [Gemmatirosa sp.]
MPSEPTAGEGRSLPSLLKDFAEGSAQLIRHEVRLARTEAGELGRHLGSGAAAVASGGVLALVGALAFVVGLIMLAGDQWLQDRYWLAALLVLVIAGAVAVIFAKRGLALLSPAHLVPDQTVATLQEDVEWLKQQRT